MPNEADEIQVSYFALCDQVITEAHTNKQSLIGIYSVLMTDQLPMHANIAVGLGIRVQSARARELRFAFNGPDGEPIFSTPPLPYDWSTSQASIESTGFATLQFGLNLRGMEFRRTGTYTAVAYCDGALIATYPFSVMPTPTA